MKTRNLIIFAMLSTLLVLTSFSKYGMTCQAQETELYPVRVNGKEGYIDVTGRIVIKPQFDAAWEVFSEGLAPVKVGEKWGYVDKTGKIVITPQFDIAFGFSEGLAMVKVGEKYGYIDKTGKIVINPQFTEAGAFSEGLAKVRIGDFHDGKCGYIDKTGKYVINLQYSKALEFKEGLACVMTGKYDGYWEWRFIDKYGNYYFDQPMNNLSYGFHEGLANVEYGDRKGFIDRTGRMVINTQSYNSVHEFNDGLAIVQTYNYNPSDDYRYHNVLTGFIDKTGRLVIKLQYYCARPFSEGLSCVRVGGKYGVGRYGFIDKTGTYVINPQYDYAESFRGGIAPVVINNKFQYIDKKGNNIWTSTEYPSYINQSISYFDQDWYNLSY